MRTRSAAALLAGCLVLCFGVAGARGSLADHQVEQMLLDVPSTQGALNDSARLNEEAHYPGTTGDRDMAIWMRDTLRDYGFQAEIEKVYAPVPYLHRAVLELLTTPSVGFDLKEARIDADPDGSRDDAGIPFNAWSGSGEVTAPLVYANRGLDADYRTLRQAGVSVDGRIVLIRYGAEFRGELARRAQDRGAAGVILYSDPAGLDGAMHGAAYPNGPYRPLGSVQRGSLNRPRLTIPVLPVSALVAQRLLQAVQGQPPPSGWRGGLDAAYALGQSTASVHLRVDESYSWIALWNTVGVLPGRDSSREVILGGHRDAWVYGVTDNGSGISSLLEAARALGYAYRSGWRPHYSIEVAGWDGEEVGEIGSDSYVRSHFDRLLAGCIAYVNADEVTTGTFFRASGVAALGGVVSEISREVSDPLDRTRTMWDTWRRQAGGITIRPPGGGSDHEAFLYLVGIPTLEFGFSGPFGVYHSAYDDLRYATTQADPGFVHHRTMAQLLALAALRLSRDPLPYRLWPYARLMRGALDRLRAADRIHVDLKPVRNAIDRFAVSSAQWDLHPSEAGTAIDAVHALDKLFYGREGYASIAFPDLTRALASGEASKAQRAVDTTARTLDGIAHSLRPASR